MEFAAVHTVDSQSLLSNKLEAVDGVGGMSECELVATGGLDRLVYQKRAYTPRRGQKKEAKWTFSEVKEASKMLEISDFSSWMI
jgi:hypothetical protein